MNAGDFSGERVIPGRVNVDLWNEHFARYLLAARLVSGRVLDAGCGSGYGSVQLAGMGSFVTAIDVAADAVALARNTAGDNSVQWTCGTCESLPFADKSFDAVVAFEVIEHLRDWPGLIAEAYRVLTPEGLFVVSTPNKSFYAETRRETGPNPFHEHEFEFDEFRDALHARFPCVSFLLQDHAEGILFRALPDGAEPAAYLEPSETGPQDASFFIAVCSLQPLPAVSPFVYIPRAANALKEKLLHIERLQSEIATKDRWLAEQQSSHLALLEKHRQQGDELQEITQWANQQVAKLQGELAKMAEGYERQVSELNTLVEERTRFGQATEGRLTAELEERTADLHSQVAELGRCVELLHQTEASLEERTRWALQLNEDRDRLAVTLGAVKASRWVRLGRMAGVGPELPDH